ncbi:hypothetical protein CRG98_037432 [Punica granatum]|uniref:Uncharacterized protein n=1 Tax=Punica granatum TaxID=22663 RepID=A0A2I0IEH7_PUNGR|nr:hypothetical protein CRG98_037432 [Punica granatum]
MSNQYAIGAHVCSPLPTIFTVVELRNPEAFLDRVESRVSHADMLVLDSPSYSRSNQDGDILPLGSNRAPAIKIDMSKAYDRVEWGFLEVVLLRMSFQPAVNRWIMECVSTVSFSVLLNGQQTPEFVPTRGLRQGDPLSSYLSIPRDTPATIQENFQRRLRIQEMKPTDKYLGDGHSIDFWTDPWVPNYDPLLAWATDDTLTWRPHSTGVYSKKSGYLTLIRATTTSTLFGATIILTDTSRVVGIVVSSVPGDSSLRAEGLACGTVLLLAVRLGCQVQALYTDSSILQTALVDSGKTPPDLFGIASNSAHLMGILNHPVCYHCPR